MFSLSAFGPYLATASRLTVESMRRQAIGVAVLVIVVKGLPGDSRVDIEWGAAAFCASVLLSIFISRHLEGQE